MYQDSISSQKGGRGLTTISFTYLGDNIIPWPSALGMHTAERTTNRAKQVENIVGLVVVEVGGEWLSIEAIKRRSRESYELMKRWSLGLNHERTSPLPHPREVSKIKINSFVLPCRETRPLIITGSNLLPGRLLEGYMSYTCCEWIMDQIRRERPRPRWPFVCHTSSESSDHIPFRISYRYMSASIYTVAVLPSTSRRTKNGFSHVRDRASVTLRQYRHCQ